MRHPMILRGANRPVKDEGPFAEIEARYADADMTGIAEPSAPSPDAGRYAWEQEHGVPKHRQSGIVISRERYEQLLQYERAESGLGG